MKRRDALLAAALIVIGALADATSFEGVRIFDDHNLERPGMDVAGALRAWKLRPVVAIADAFNLAVNGWEPAGYHVLNLVVHVLAGLLLFGLARRTLERTRLGRDPTRARAIAFAAATLWLVHPLQTESVTYIAGRAQSLMGLFELAFFYAIARRHDSPRPRSWQIVAVLSFALSMGSKPHAALAPVIALLYDRTFFGGSLGTTLRRSPVLYGLLTFAWVGASGWIAYRFTVNGHSFLEANGRGPGLYALAQLTVVPHYLRVAVWPDELCLDLGWTPVLHGWEALPGGLLLGGLGLATIAASVRRSAWGFMGAWFFLNLAPVSSFIPREDLAVEHRMYIPLASITLIFALVLDRIRRVLGARTAPIVGRLFFGVSLALVAFALGARTWARNADYVSELGMWEKNAALRPGNLRPRAGVVWSHERLGEWREALAAREEIFQLGMELPVLREFESIYWNALTELGPLVAQEGDVGATAAYQRGLVELMLHRFSDVDADLTRALALRPDDAAARMRRGAFRHQRGRDAEAFTDFDAATRLAPETCRAWLGRGQAEVGLGRWAAADEDLTRAIALRPECLLAYQIRAQARARLGHLAEAADDERIGAILATTPAPLRRR